MCVSDQSRGFVCMGCVEWRCACVLCRVEVSYCVEGSMCLRNKEGKTIVCLTILRIHVCSGKS